MHFFPLLWNRVEAELARKRLAAQEAFESQPDAAGYTESLDGFVGVARASGLEAATTSEEQRQVRLVKTQRE